MNANKNCKPNQKKGNGNRNRRNRRKDKEIEVNVKDSDVNKQDVKGFDNDYTWYTHYPTYFENVTGVNFGTPVGSPLNWGYTSEVTIVSGVPTVPGIMQIGFIPTLGTMNGDVFSVTNKVSAQLYAAMRQKLGSTASYDATDIMLYLGAMDSAYCLYALGAKIYGLLNVASPFNNYMLRRLLESMSVDYDSFHDNMSNFRSQINQFAIFLSSRAVPASFDIFKRHVWMIQNLWTDSNSAKAQIYGMRLDGYYTYTEVTEGPAYLKFTPMPYYSAPGTMFTLNSWLAAIEQVTTGILGSSDIDQMSADLMKAFENDIFAISLIPDDYVTGIGYSTEMLTQIENCILNGILDNSERNDVTGRNNFDIIQHTELSAVVTYPYLSANYQFTIPVPSTNPTAAQQSQIQAWTQRDRLINFHTSEISKEDIIVATRGIPGSHYMPATVGSDPINKIVVQDYGTEIYTQALAFYMSGASLESVQYQSLKFEQTVGTTGLHFAVWNSFDWAPAIDVAGATGTSWYRFQDLDMYAIIGHNQLTDMNRNAVLSEFYSSAFPQVQG